MKNLFIDSNIWLSLYHFTSDDLTQFEKLKNLLGKDIRLWIPYQVYDEVLRNREAKIKDAFKKFEFSKIQYPVFCQQYDEYTQFTTDYDELLKRHTAWKRKIVGDIQSVNLPADKTIKLLFKATGLLKCDSVVDKAYNRYRIGNPPGKDNKFGDAINWECLLQNVPDGEDLYLISADKDYRSTLFDGMLNPFLDNEWKQKKRGKVHFYTSLVSFLGEHVKEIKLKTETEKQELIEKLVNSPNFITTHGVIAMMNKYTDWTATQIENLCSAVVDNTQVGRILGDDDVFEFFSRLLNNPKFHEMKECSISRVLEELHMLTQERAQEGKEGWELEINEMKEDISHYPWLG